MQIDEMREKHCLTRVPTPLPFPEYCYVDTAFGNAKYRNKVKRLDQVEVPANVSDCYVSMFRFTEELRTLCETTGSVKGASRLPCCGDYLWFDIDSEDLNAALVNARLLVDGIESIDGSLSQHLTIYFSGAKGFHVGIPSPLFGVKPSVDLPRVFRELAHKIAGDVPIDAAIYEHSRLWRVPNTRNSKSGLFKIPLTYGLFATGSIEQIRKAATAPTGQPFICLCDGPVSEPDGSLQAIYTSAKSSRRQMSIASRIPPVPNRGGWISRALRGLQKGNRNTTFAQITGCLSRNGWEPEDILALLEPHARISNFPVEELQREIRGICRRYPVTTPFPFPTLYRGETETESKPLEALPLIDFLAGGEAEITWRVERLLPTEGVGILAGPAGYGKSWMLLDLAVECARGGRWLGQFATSKGTVLYVDEESAPALLRHRLRKLLAGKGLDTVSLDIHFATGQGLCLNERASAACLRRLLGALKPNLVIVDSLIRVHRAEENSATDMSRVFAVVKGLVRETGCLFVFADHQRKPGHYRSSLDLLLRGTSEKAAFVDTLLSLQRREDVLIVEHSKSRFAEPESTFVVRIEDRVPDTTTVAYVGEADAIKQAARLDAARAFLTEAIPIGDSISRKDLLGLAREHDISAKALDEALKALESEGLIGREDRSPESGRGGKAAFYMRKADSGGDG